MPCGNRFSGVIIVFHRSETLTTPDAGMTIAELTTVLKRYIYDNAHDVQFNLSDEDIRDTYRYVWKEILIECNEIEEGR